MCTQCMQINSRCCCCFCCCWWWWYLCTESKLGCEERATAVTSDNCPQWWTLWQSSLPLQTGQSYLPPFNLSLVHTYWASYFSFCLCTGVLFSFIFFCVWMCPKSKENWTWDRGDADCEFIWLVIFVLVETLFVYISLVTFFDIEFARWNHWSWMM